MQFTITRARARVCVCVDNYTVKLECSLLEYTIPVYLGFCGAYIVTF